MTEVLCAIVRSSSPSKQLHPNSPSQQADQEAMASNISFTALERVGFGDTYRLLLAALYFQFGIQGLVSSGGVAPSLDHH